MRQRRESPMETLKSDEEKVRQGRLKSTTGQHQFYFFSTLKCINSDLIKPFYSFVLAVKRWPSGSLRNNAAYLNNGDRKRPQDPRFSC